MQKRVVIFVDEFEVIVSNEKFERDFFSFLRSQANIFNLAFVISSREELYTFCKRKDIKESNFWNIFTMIGLSLFERKDSLELIRKLSSEEGCQLEDYSDFILELAGDHPFYLQIACSAVFDFLECHEDISKGDFETVEDEFRDEAWNHFRYLWDSLTEQEKTVLSALTAGERVEKTYELSELENKGILRKEKNDYESFSRYFSEFVQEQCLGPEEDENNSKSSSGSSLSAHEFARVFGAEAREKILHFLLSQDAEVTDIAELLSMTRPGVERHLKMLLKFNLINKRVILKPRYKNEYFISERGKQELKTFDEMKKTIPRQKHSGSIEVLVSAAPPKDEGKHIVRLPISIKRKLKVRSGDYVILEKENGKSVQCEAKTIRSEDGEKVFIDSDTMRHISARNGDSILIKKRTEEVGDN
ncbi:MAG: ArsR family transcriptional regulator [Candidatus Methanofastidiosia archaeon]